MSITMNESELTQLKVQISQLAKGLKSQSELGDLTQ